MNGKCLVAPIILGDIILGTKLRVAEVAGHTVVVGDHYEDGVLGFHVPHGAILPLSLLEDMWLVGRLAGKAKNRVQAREIHGVLSDGLFYGSRYHTEMDGVRTYHHSRSWQEGWLEGQDVAQMLVDTSGSSLITFKG